MTKLPEEIKFILMDIEGTTTSIDFVHKNLFPFSFQRMGEFIKNNRTQPDVQKALAEVGETVFHETGKRPSEEEYADILKQWITADRKHGALKSIQGLIWQEGYEVGLIRGHVYDDVPAALNDWKRQGLQLGIYSSGSVLAQKLIFGFSTAGNLNNLISKNFDTEVGMKRDPQSYKNISEKLGLKPESILFLSDISQELSAAKSAGFRTVQILREGQAAEAGFSNSKSFLEIGEIS